MRMPNLHAVIVGAGFAGLYMLHRLRRLGLPARVFEAGDGIGGTWYWNRYPGARCDVESMDYSYSFSDELQQEWKWSERYGVIGTGSSAIQSIPIIAEQAAHLFVFQRTPNFSVPARNAPLDPDFERQVKARYADFRRQARESRVGFVGERSEASALAVTREERRREYERRWSRGGLGFTATYVDLLTNTD